MSADGSQNFGQHDASEPPMAAENPSKTSGRAGPSAAGTSDQVSSRREATEQDAAIPDAFSNLQELAQDGPVPSDRDQDLRRPTSRVRQPTTPTQNNQDLALCLRTKIFTLSYLVFFALMGVLARVGLTALTRYVDTPILFTTIWANFGGSFIMGFLTEDRMLFRHEWGTPHYDRALSQSKKSNDEEASSETPPSATIDVAAAKKAHLACKKTIPLYIGLATGLCGSFTSFSTFIRDLFLAMSNDMVAPGFGTETQSRNGGYSFMAMLAVIITTVSLSLSGLIFGAHCAVMTEPFMPSFPLSVTRDFLDPLFVLLGWGCWLGAIFLAIFPPAHHDAWRGQVVFSLVFAPLGCLARFYLSMYLNGRRASFPIGTFLANVLGTAVLAMAWDIAHVQSGGVLGCQVLQGVEDGFCGCLTTVSTWVSELNSLRRRSAYIYGVASILASFAIMVVIMGGLRWTDGWAVLQC